MTEPYDHTIDWDEYWAETRRDDVEEMVEAGKRMARRLETFFGDEFPSSLASVGCGHATTLFSLAGRHESTDFYGFDAAGPIVRRNRERADDERLDDLTFETATLPDFEPGRTFDCITCIATLHYVENVECAIANLYDRLEPGGTLIFNYPNRRTRRMYHESDADEERFRLVLDGQNLLSYREIRRVLGTEVRSFWKAVGEDDWREVGRTNPCVYVEK